MRGAGTPDYHMGRILDAIEEMGEVDNTL